MLSPGVSVKLTGSGSSALVALQAASRYQPQLQAVASSSSVAGSVTAVSVIVQSNNEVLDRFTSYAYNVTFASGSTSVLVSAASPFGVAYALETLVQLSEDRDTCGSGGSFGVADAPDFPHRGLMIDTGRRFYSVSLVESILEGMAVMKMNVLHMFLSELCFRVESKLFPGLHTQVNCTGPHPKPGLVNNGYYTQAEIAQLVEYGRLRGVRLIPEFDMPGHAGGLCRGLEQSGIDCCSNGGMGVPQIHDDAAGKSVGVVTKVIGEMSALFPDSVLHIGGDETGSTAPCDMADTKSFEVKMIDYVKTNLGKVRQDICMCTRTHMQLIYYTEIISASSYFI